MRYSALRVSALALLPALLSGACAHPPPERRDDRAFENLVLVVVDTLRSDHLGSYGAGTGTTPFLDGLAAESVQLQGYAATSWTRPSVATLLTGLYPQRHRAVGRDDRLPSAVPYLPALVRPHGFQTAALVVNGNVGAQFGFARGFGAFVEAHEGGKPDASALVDELRALVTPLSAPFFLYVHLIDPHDPYLPKQAWGRPDLDRGAYVQPAELIRGDLDASDEVVDRLVAQYDGEIAELDRGLEAMFELLEETGTLERSLVVLTSDHGEEFGEHGSFAHGHGLYEEVIQVPFLVWADEGLPVAHSTMPFHHVDLMPTVLEALGVPRPPDLDGVSRWAEVATGRFGDVGERLFNLEVDGFRASAIHRGALRYIRQAHAPPELWYRLEAGDDAHPVDAMGDLDRELADRERQLVRRRFEREAATASGEVKEQLEALGYLGGG